MSWYNISESWNEGWKGVCTTRRVVRISIVLFRVVLYKNCNGVCLFDDERLRE